MVKKGYDPFSYVLLKNGRVGQVRWAGKLPGKKGFWLGLQLMNATGKHDGTYKKKHLFRCKKNTGTFVRENRVIDTCPLDENWRKLTGETIPDFVEHKADTTSPKKRKRTSTLGK